MKIFALLTGLALLVSGPAQAFGNDDTWTTGYGMGIAEAVITKGAGNQIYVTCGIPTPGRPVTSISFTLAGDSSKDNSILLTFDNEAPQEFSLWDGDIQSASRAGASQFEYVIAKFRAKQWVNVRFEDGTNTTFSLKGANKAIGECPTDFSQ